MIGLYNSAIATTRAQLTEIYTYIGCTDSPQDNGGWLPLHVTGDVSNRVYRIPCHLYEDAHTTLLLN